jgi:hypothetical protein
MRASALVLGGLVTLAPGCNPAHYPDEGALRGAEAGWCDALAKLAHAGASWDSMSACKAAAPAASAGFIRGMTKCFPEHKASGGDKSVDNGLLVAECRDEVLLKMSIDESVAREGVDARCARAVRCENANLDDCLAAAKKIEGVQRATLYGMYNAAALHRIAECLRSSACGADENAAQSACYALAEEKLIWFP